MSGAASGRLVVEAAAKELSLRVIQRKPKVRTITLIRPALNKLVFFTSLSLFKSAKASPKPSEAGLFPLRSAFRSICFALMSSCRQLDARLLRQSAAAAGGWVLTPLHLLCKGQTDWCVVQVHQFSIVQPEHSSSSGRTSLLLNYPPRKRPAQVCDGIRLPCCRRTVQTLLHPY